ncbi:aromatic acid exporter family protein [Streptomyces sp. ALI-76-A]|uniref:FUSC family protein n=1 Tax=Streptomyces sp. ALI-76-A TaxID=3025736 RepID=UPI00256EA138|nr:aromatic acid exporter family protein [Streptomyces sp. ALI-76-A]MDL5205507.1 aromatic acid exporter family protein [Streptomyces sp. ALI-76-A]
MTRVTDAVRPRAGRPADALRQEAHAVARAGRAAWCEPGRERDLVVQSMKAAAAALIAWSVASYWLSDPMALMAPWVAMVLVQATIYSSLRQAAQQWTAMCAGTLLASAAQALTGNTLGALALSVPVLMLLANWHRFGDQGIYGATTAVFTIASGAVSASAVGHRVGQAALGAVIGIAVNAFVFPPIHLRDVGENLAALARESGDVLCGIAGDLRHTEWDAQSTARWSGEAARLERRLNALRSARAWSRESLRLTAGPLRAVNRAPRSLPPEEEDERWGRVTGHIGALTRTLTVAADPGRTPVPPDARALRSYAGLLELIADACHAESDRLRDPRADTRPDGDGEDAMGELHEQLQEELQEHAAGGAARATVLGTLLLQAENIWTETVPSARKQ